MESFIIVMQKVICDFMWANTVNFMSYKNTLNFQTFNFSFIYISNENKRENTKYIPFDIHKVFASIVTK